MGRDQSRERRTFQPRRGGGARRTLGQPRSRRRAERPRPPARSVPARRARASPPAKCPRRSPSPRGRATARVSRVKRLGEGEGANDDGGDGRGRGVRGGGVGGGDAARRTRTQLARTRFRRCRRSSPRDRRAVDVPGGRGGGRLASEGEEGVRALRVRPSDPRTDASAAVRHRRRRRTRDDTRENLADAWLDACGRAEEDVTRVALTQ